MCKGSESLVYKALRLCFAYWHHATLGFVRVYSRLRQGAQEGRGQAAQGAEGARSQAAAPLLDEEGPPRAAQERLLQGRVLRLEEDDEEQGGLQGRLQVDRRGAGLAGAAPQRGGLA